MRFASLFLFGCALVSAATTLTDKIVKKLQKIEKLSQDAIPKVNKLTVEDGNRLNETSGRFQVRDHTRLFSIRNILAVEDILAHLVGFLEHLQSL